MAEHHDGEPEHQPTDAARSPETADAAEPDVDTVAAQDDAPEDAGSAEAGPAEGAAAEGAAAEGAAAEAIDPVNDEARRALEAVLMVADQPIEASLLAQLVERSPQQVEDLLAGLAASYEEDGRGFQLVRVAGGWRYQSHEDLSPYVERFILSGQTARLSAAALETLAIVAYKQPISRAQVSAIRGVNVDGVMRTLQQRGYIAEVGKDPGPGQPSMFGTTKLFLEKLGLNSIDELPSLGDFIPGADVVELLEQGLRAESEESPAAPEAGDGADGPDGPDGGDGAGEAAAEAASESPSSEQAEQVAATDEADGAEQAAEPAGGVVDITGEVVISVDELAHDAHADPTTPRPSPSGE